MPKHLKGEQAVQCIYCRSQIDSKALLCPVCRSYQSGWRNSMVYLAGLAGLLGLLGTAGVFVASKIPDLYKMMAWTDTVRVWDFESGLYPIFGAKISNVGDGPVLLSKILVRYGKGGNAEYELGRTLQPNETMVVQRQIEEVSEYDGYLATKSGQPTKILDDNSNITRLDEGFSSRPCFASMLYHKNALALIRMDEAYGQGGTKLVKAEAQAYIIYISLHHSREERVEFPVVMTFNHSTRPGCSWDKFRD
jgi:hypothetical protein